MALQYSQLSVIVTSRFHSFFPSCFYSPALSFWDISSLFLTHSYTILLNYLQFLYLLSYPSSPAPHLWQLHPHFPNASSLTNPPGSTAQEKTLGGLMSEKHSTDFYTIDKFPRSARPFYTHPDPHNPDLTNSYDFFMRGQEIMSGAQRIHNYQQLCENMRNNDPPLDPLSEGFRHYTDAFRYGCPPHGGGGLGLNRITQFYLGLPDIRFATLFVRDPGRLAP